MGGIAVILLVSYFTLFAPRDYRSTTYLYSIPTGVSISQIIGSLVEQGYLRSELGGKIAFRLTGASVVKSGTYNISPRMNAWQIASVVKNGETAGARVTVPEGYTIEQIAERLQSLGILDSREFTEGLATVDLSAYDFIPPQNPKVKNRLEGYLFPDTYDFYRGMPATEIVTRLLKNFDARTSQIQAGVKPQDLDLAELVTLASLVEKEARTDADRKLIAGVLLNRITSGMRLDVDASVRFITNNWTKPITKADLESDSPYNTRRFAGLPPGPICNPGLAALEAVVSPTASDYLYYLTDSDGVTHYAKTLEEHNQNKAKYL